MTRRRPTHAYSGWYTSDAAALSQDLDEWLDAVPQKVQCIGAKSSQDDPYEPPSAGARVIIAPHAGYAYSGPAAAWAYKSLNLSNIKRVFLLGPSHHYVLHTLALSQCTTYCTPLGDLRVDTATIAELHAAKKFEKMSKSQDEQEHSLEMHLPYLYKVFQREFGRDESNYPPIVPILVGSTSPSIERTYGKLLASYLAEPSNAFVISSDFAHWGRRFAYMRYKPASGPLIDLRKTSPKSVDLTKPTILESIKSIDRECMDAIETGSFNAFWDALEETHNTVCGRHPIGVMMAAIEAFRDDGGINGDDQDGKKVKGKFRFVRHETSSKYVGVEDSSVSYCSAFAIL